MPTLNSLLLHSTRYGSDLMAFEIHRSLCDHFCDQYVLVTDSYSFDLASFRNDGKCMIWELDELNSLVYTQWYGPEKGVQRDYQFAFFEVLWNGQHVKCLQCEIDYETISFVIAGTPNLAHGLFEAVCRYSQDSDGRIIVFNGCFRREPDMEKEVQEASWDSLVFPEDSKQSLHQNVLDFFEGKEMYAKYHMPWKRGVLLHGPPGNGKTHAIKSLVKEAKRPCVVVKSFRVNNDLEEKAIARVFWRARQMAPAILVLEDIDSLIQRSNLSSLLNEMDGFSSNEGLLFLASTNHLEKLDEALSKRPSRFDRKFEFPNPKRKQRLAFLEARFGRLVEDMRPSSEKLQAISLAAKGFSGAMLQELVTSCTMAWVQAEGRRSMDDVLAEQSTAMTPVRTVASAARSSRLASPVVKGRKSGK